MQAIKISVYLLAFVLSNYLVLWFGPTGLIFTALFLIPFDYVMRCIFHETWKGIELIGKLGAIVFLASIITYVINNDTKEIAVASVCAFIFAQLTAGVFYQAAIKKPYIIKVNGSDLVAIVFDTIVFQSIAFGYVNWKIGLSQIALKIIGGIFWYWLLFHKYKIQDRAL